jgi:hypothetical protein
MQQRSTESGSEGMRRRGGSLTLAVLAVLVLTLMALAAPAGAAGFSPLGAHAGGGPYYMLDTDVVGQGQIEVVPLKAFYEGGETVTLTETPDAYQEFVGWAGSAQGSARSVTLTMDGDKDVTAIFKPQTFDITVTYNSGGTVTPDPANPYDYGDSATFEITPNRGYYVLDVLVDSVSLGPCTSYTDSFIDADSTVQAIFAQYTYVLTPSATAGGTIIPSIPQIVGYGDNFGFRMVPDSHYHVSGLVVDGTSRGPANAFVFMTVKADHTICAQFAVDTYSVTPTVTGGHGRITPGASQNVPYGGRQTFTFTPDAGYAVQTVLVNGRAVPNRTSYTFTNVTANQTIAVTFAPVQFTVNATYSGSGTLSPAGSVKVNSGASQAFTMTPSPGYAVDNVQVDGAWIGSRTQYTFSNVTANHSISVTFKKVVVSIKVTIPSSGQWKQGSRAVISWNVTPSVTSGTFEVWARDTQTGVNTRLTSMSASGASSYSTAYTVGLTIGRSYYIVVTYNTSQATGRSSGAISVVR